MGRLTFDIREARLRHSPQNTCAVDRQLRFLPRGFRADDLCGEDQRQMRERLWEVSDLSTQRRLVFLGQQSQVVAQFQQAFE